MVRVAESPADMVTGVRSPIPPLGTVLCAVDASPGAAAVLYAASGLASHPQSRLRVLRVDDRAGSHGEPARAAQAELQGLVERTIPEWISGREGTDVIVRAGSPAETILAAAAECGATLVVIGTHARGFVSRALFGSVAAQIMRGTTVPLAVVPPSDLEVISLTDEGAVAHLGSVLVPLGLDAGSARQLAFAAKLSLASSRELVLLHVVPPDADSQAPLTRLKEMAVGLHAHAGARAIVTHGAVVGVILERQARSGAGVVVMGRDPHSPGSIARELLQRSRAVVVFVP